MLGQGQLPPNYRPFPQMWHETLFDELKASAYRCKKERSVAFKIDLRQNAFLEGALPQAIPTCTPQLQSITAL